MHRNEIYPCSVIQYFKQYYDINSINELKYILRKCVEGKIEEKYLQIKQKFSKKELEKMYLMLEYIMDFYKNNYKLYDINYVYKKYLEEEGDKEICKTENLIFEFISLLLILFLLY